MLPGGGDPLTRWNWPRASIMPTSRQRSAMFPFCQFFTFREWVRADRDHRLDRVGRAQCPRQRRRHVQPPHGERLLQPRSAHRGHVLLLTAAITCNPAPTASASIPSRMSSASSANATLTVSGAPHFLAAVTALVILLHGGPLQVDLLGRTRHLPRGGHESTRLLDKSRAWALAQGADANSRLGPMPPPVGPRHREGGLSPTFDLVNSPAGFRTCIQPFLGAVTAAARCTCSDRTTGAARGDNNAFSSGRP